MPSPPPPAVPMIMRARVHAALRGAFCADAASMGTHWTYDPAEMKTIVPSLDAPEFKLDPPTPKYYSAEEFSGHYGPGMLSPYGEQLLFVTDFMATTTTASNDPLDGDVFSTAMLEWATTFGGRPDSAMNKFVENMNKEDGSGKWPNCGADDNQAHIYMKIVPVVCRYAGLPDLLDRVDTSIRVHQNNDQAVAFAKASARILEAILLGATDLKEVVETCEANLAKEEEDFAEKELVLTAFADVKAHMEESNEELKDLDAVLLDYSHKLMKDKPDSPFYNLAARSCALPGSFVGPLFLFLKAASGGYGDDKSSWYEQALRENILASGDTCSRAVFIGAVFGALAEEIPESWTSRMHQETLATVDKAVDVIIGAAASTETK